MNNTNNNNADSPQWDVVYQYTRSQAIADGFQIEVTKTAQEAGIRFPGFITRGVYEQCVAAPCVPASNDNWISSCLRLVEPLTFESWDCSIHF